ncbi:hypothetical protein GO620_006040 [Mucilaginibacter ginkgonis]|uniref:Damage-inducible protein DinB n=2 Tax=Mucilaginibacter ginkgonis TaxID=2682091 RepID=A0A6I4HVS1_9SPHI|nr:hypothetical protein GO620_006040 [Mucilaginibacter ginkgonis]
MYRHIQDFLNDWKSEEANTLKIFTEITHDTKSKEINVNVRTIEKLAWHITHSITEMAAAAGILETDQLAETPMPETMAGITELYQKYCGVFAQALRSKWTDSALEDGIPMYGETWKKGRFLQIIIAHQTHHRSQMTVVMRMVGLPVPGIFGPSKEEWEFMGLPAME